MKNFVLIFLSVSLIKLYKIFLGTSHKGVTSRPKFSTKKMIVCILMSFLMIWILVGPLSQFSSTIEHRNQTSFGILGCRLEKFNQRERSCRMDQNNYIGLDELETNGFIHENEWQSSFFFGTIWFWIYFIIKGQKYEKPVFQKICQNTPLSRA